MTLFRLARPLRPARSMPGNGARTRTALVTLAVALRAACIARYRIDSDEAQHLHVAWLWSHGEIAYRDFYDNHTPLFHLLFAPLVRAAGETPHILLIGRLMMLPLAAAALLLVYRIAARVYDRRVAFWSALCVAILPPLVLKSVEFRSDNLWVVWSLLAFALLLEPLSPRRAALAGTLLAVSLLTSIKTIFVAAALAVTIIVVDGVGAAIIAAAAWLARHDAWRAFIWCTVTLNRLLPVAPWRRIVGEALLLPVIGTIVVLLRWQRDRPRPTRLLAGGTAIFIALVFGLSPTIAPRDGLPAFPLLAILAVAALAARRAAILPFAAAALVVITTVEGTLWREPDDYAQRLVAQVLAVSAPTDPVLDLKGESIFRPRASYLALEVVARRAIEQGIVPETFIDDVVARRCYVVTRDAEFFPPQTRAFLNRYFISAGDLRVAGSVVGDDGTFAVGVPGPYSTLAADGSLLERNVWLEAGVHRAPPAARAVIWSPAVERGAWLSRDLLARRGAPRVAHASQSPPS